MYQGVYPWLCRDQFALHVPGTYDDETWSIPKKKQIHFIRTQYSEQQMHAVQISTNYRDVEIVTEYDDATPTTKPNLHVASQKLLNFIEKRDVHVVFHGPDVCNDKRPWSRYEHFHLTWTSKYRAGLDTIWNGVTAMYKAVSHGTSIPNTQTTQFPASWANYLAQEPRITWRTPRDITMQKFACWVFQPHVERPVDNPKPGSSSCDAAESSAATKYDFVLPSGKTMNLYKYIKYLVQSFGHSCKEDLVEGALKAKDTSTFEKALTHPYFDNVVNKVFAVDQALEQMQGFKQLYSKMQWEKFTDSDRFLTVDASLRLFRHLLKHHDIHVETFVDDVWRLVTFAQAKTNSVTYRGHNPNMPDMDHDGGGEPQVGPADTAVGSIIHENLQPSHADTSGIRTYSFSRTFQHYIQNKEDPTGNFHYTPMTSPGE